MERHHGVDEVLLVSLLCCSPSILAVSLTVSVPGTLVALGAGAAAAIRRAPTRRWFGRRRAGRGR